jgi:hypothetical protein
MKINEILTEAKSAHPQQAAVAIAMKKAGKKPKNESVELEEEFDLIESIIERLAQHNGVDAEVIWEDLETLTEDELYVFAVTSEPIMESQGVAEGAPELLKKEMPTHRHAEKLLAQNGVSKDDPDYHHHLNNTIKYLRQFGNIDLINKSDEQGVAEGEKYKVKSIGHDAKGDYYISPSTGKKVYKSGVKVGDHENPKTGEHKGVAESEAWQKANNRDHTDGMSRKAVNTYRREHPGSKLQTAVTTKPSKLKKGSKASKRRSSYCSRSRGQMKMHSISCSKTPDKAICKARRRWNC